MNVFSVSFLLCTLVLSSAARASDWSVKSKETQFEQQSDYISKSSLGSKTQLQPQAKSGTAALTGKALQGAPARQLSARSAVSNFDHEFWIYDAWVTFNTDLDADGYFYHFSLEFDADTLYESAQVYARLYLTKGDIFQEYHTTSVFTIEGEDERDSFVVESELLSGFQPGDYEVLVELYDADTDLLVVVYDGFEDADLTLLPLESKDYDEVYVGPPVVIVQEHGGSVGWLMLLLLPLLGWRYRPIK